MLATASDASLLELINQRWTSPFLDRLMTLVSSLDAWVPFMAIGVLCALIFGGKVGRRAVVGIAVVLVVTDSLIGMPLKKCVGKLRPYEVSESVVRRDLAKKSFRIMGIFEEPVIKKASIAKLGASGNSFPSNHVLNVTGVSVFLVFLLGRRALWILALPILMAYSRIYCGAHWPTDMPHSFLFGALAAWGVWHFLGKWIRGPRPAAPVSPAASDS